MSGRLFNADDPLGAIGKGLPTEFKCPRCGNPLTLHQHPPVSLELRFMFACTYSWRGRLKQEHSGTCRHHDHGSCTCGADEANAKPGCENTHVTLTMAEVMTASSRGEVARIVRRKYEEASGLRQTASERVTSEEEPKQKSLAEQRKEDAPW